MFELRGSMASPDQEPIQFTRVHWPAAHVKLRWEAFSCPLEKTQGGEVLASDPQWVPVG